MTVRYIHEIVDPGSILTQADAEIDAQRTLDLYTESLRQELSVTFPAADVSVTLSSTGHTEIACDSDDERLDIETVGWDHFNRGGFWVLLDGSVV